MFFLAKSGQKKVQKKVGAKRRIFFLNFFLDKNFGSGGKCDFGLFFEQKTEKNGPEGPDFWEISFFLTFFWTRKKSWKIDFFWKFGKSLKKHCMQFIKRRAESAKPKPKITVEQFNKAKDYLKNGGKLEAIKTKYTLTSKQEETLATQYEER